MCLHIFCCFRFLFCLSIYVWYSRGVFVLVSSPPCAVAAAVAVVVLVLFPLDMTAVGHVTPLTPSPRLDAILRTRNDTHFRFSTMVLFVRTCFGLVFFFFYLLF